MKILVLSDSHSALRFMRSCVETVRPDVMIHLGDYFDDGRVLAQEYPDIRLYQVPGNCDMSYTMVDAPQIMMPRIGGLDFYLTHGHRHGVKSSDARLVREARAAKAAAVLYGHTHQAECRQEDGLWVLNPGSCGFYGGSVGLIEVRNGKIEDCRIIRQSDLEEMK